MDTLSGPGLTARLRVERGRFALTLDLTAAPGEVVALLGPNGAGKSTALQALGGLIALSAGSIVLDGDPLDDPGRDVFVPSQRRRVGYVFQDYLLFGHLSALENVAFGLRARGVDRRIAREQAAAWLDRMGLAGLGGTKPGALSGGQAQRVALARALVTDPALLLLDEPLAALDASTRLEIRSDLRQHLSDFRGSTVLVTHDPVDAMVLADRVVVVEDGATVQVGTPAEVARSPRTEYVARLMGLNLYRGHSDGTGISLESGGTLHAVDTSTGPVIVTFRPAAVAVHRNRPEGSPRNVWQGRVTGMEHYAETVRVKVDASPPVLADVTTAAIADLRLGAGDTVWVSVKATEIRVQPA